jgi:hypothetical protein
VRRKSTSIHCSYYGASMMWIISSATSKSPAVSPRITTTFPPFLASVQLAAVVDQLTSGVKDIPDFCRLQWLVGFQYLSISISHTPSGP